MAELERKTAETKYLSSGFVAPSLSALGVPHLFTTRNQAEFHGLGETEVSCASALATLGRPDAQLVTLHQVHAAGVFDGDGELPAEDPAADAVVTSRPERLIAIRVADCVPILLSNTTGTRVAAVHGGWRGLVAGVIPATLASFAGEQVIAAIGPCISSPHFEVGPEVAEAFRAVDLGSAVHPQADSNPRIDLRAAAQLQLQRCGVEVIDETSACTWGDEEHFFSYRRDVTHGGSMSTGRQYALIAVSGE
ncbi:MAG: YfiH family protein [Planctomycetota bacterium]|jgi:YfiH family protein